jgi:hypothetical protein
VRFIFYLLYASLIALGLGFGLSWYALTDGRIVGARQIGVWYAWPDTGGSHPDPYTRAYLARRGLLQLGTSEGLQFVAENDSDGQALERACTYRIDGKTPVATLWTLTATDPDGRNVAASEALAFLDSEHLSRAADGSAVIAVGPSLSAGDWLETSGTGPLRLVLNLYDTPLTGNLDWSTSEMPSITRERCT